MMMQRRSSITEEVAEVMQELPKSPGSVRRLFTRKLKHLKKQPTRRGSKNLAKVHASNIGTNFGAQGTLKPFFDDFKVFKYVEYPEMNELKIKAMTSVPDDNSGLEQKMSRGITSFRSFRSLSWSGRKYYETYCKFKAISWRSENRTRINKLLFVLALLECFLAPQLLVFGKGTDFISSKFQNIVSVVFALDFVLNFFTSFQSKVGREITRLDQIAVRYLLSWALVDGCAMIPTTLAINDPETSTAPAYDPAAKSPIDSMTTFLLVVTFAKFLRENHRLRKCSVTYESAIWHFFSTVASIFWVTQVATVAFFAVCQMEESIWWETQYIGDLDSMDPSMRYVVYLHATVFFVLGKGSPTTTSERMLGLGFNIFGLFVTASLIGQVSHMLQVYYAKETKWRAKLNNINHSMAEMGLSTELQERIRSYYAFSWAINGGDTSSDSWLNELSQTYREQAKVEVNEELISNVPIFQNSNRQFVLAIVMNLKQILYLPGDYIIRYGDFGSEMYFVVRGCVHAMDEAENTLYTILSEGCFFGEIALLKKNSRRTATVRSFTYSQLNVLYKEDFFDICGKFPQEAEMMSEQARKREQNSKNIEKLKAKQEKGSAAIRRTTDAAKSLSAVERAESLQAIFSAAQADAFMSNEEAARVKPTENATNIEDHQPTIPAQEEARVEKEGSGIVDSGSILASTGHEERQSSENASKPTSGFSRLKNVGKEVMIKQRTLAFLDAEGEIEDLGRKGRNSRKSVSLAAQGGTELVDAINNLIHVMKIAKTYAIGRKESSGE